MEVLKLEYKTKLRYNNEKTSLEKNCEKNEFIETLLTVDFNNRTEESKYK